MSLNDIASMAENLLVITGVNAVIGIGIAIVYIGIRETLAMRKEKKRKEEDDDTYIIRR